MRREREREREREGERGERERERGREGERGEREKGGETHLLPLLVLQLLLVLCHTIPVLLSFLLRLGERTKSEINFKSIT